MEAEQDIVNITKYISEQIISKNINIDDIDEDLISKFSCCPVDEIDLLIRTGGDKENKQLSFIPNSIY